MVLSATEFKARCLAVLDQVRDRGESVTITKRGRIVARLVPASQAVDRPWQALAGRARWHGDPLAPVLNESEIDALS